ncbi:MAG: hypothetical protein HY815_23800 [Candidatus Riflebacteria bacterium]|nr:hypothetical protein [Candidatus Riflebacteria bacterium]
MRAKRQGFSIVELAVSVGIFSLILYILMTATSLAKTYFLSDQLSHAIQAAVVLGSELEDDLRQAVRDPKTGQALKVGTEAGLSLSFYRGVAAPQETAVIAVPTRWSLKEEPSAKVGYLSRTTWNLDRSTWETTNYRWAPIPMAAPPDAGACGAPVNPMGFALVGDSAGAGDTANLVQTVVLTVLARERAVQSAGAGQDRASVQIAVAVPHLPHFAALLFQPVKTLADLPAE